MVTLVPSWNEVAGAYPYAPGRGDLSDESWKLLKQAEQDKRKAQREAQKVARETQRKNEKAFREYEKDWAKAEDEMSSGYILDRDELPDRNREILRQGEPTWSGLADYLVAAYDKPQNPVETAISWAGHTGEEAGKFLASWFNFGDEDKEDPNLKPWLERYIASGGGSGAGGLGDSPEMVGDPFPNLPNIGINTKAYEDAIENIKKPEYKAQDFDKWDAVAEGLANMDFLNLDMSKAVRAMNKWSEAKAKNETDTANANEEARYNTEKWQAMQRLALEELKAKNAMQNAQLAITRWQANQPRALGGNRMAWRDSAGNLHFQQIDKQGEARTVGNNAAMIEMMDLDSKKLAKMTPKKILQRANQAAMLYPDKDKIPFIQGYIMQATQMLPTKE